MTALDRFIAGLFIISKPGNLFTRYRLGLGLIARQMHRMRKTIPCRNLPTSGFHHDLWQHGQKGQMYRHLYFHLGCVLLGPAGHLLSRAMDWLDRRQQKSGRLESATEVRDNIAGRECGRILKTYLRGKSDQATARRQLRRLLREEV
jgi:hypothetical protein